ncbi:exopolysaccharide biosynthesis protein [Aerophototrophica crusticola]|uniref:Exopolysaccharide biosynthesis protein n=1 Tax=Aerophototrophica crusticola TaxID=1709002 RepID=A0A858R6V6_9PROT|nr:exopolysaccharide biosynthesis protein [Rhodospirillaceae bacterium B3]
MPMRQPEPRTSDILLAFLAGDGPDAPASPTGVPADRVSIGMLIDGMGERAYGLLMLLCALPNCVPGPPGVSTVTGMPILLFAFQMLLGSPRPWLPRFLRDRSFARSDMLTMVNKALPYMRRVERVAKPRLPGMVAGLAERVAGAVVLFLSVILVLPVPLGNLFPAVAIAIMAIALLERDGLVMLIGYVAAAASTVVAATSIYVVVKLIILGIRHFFLGE